MTHTPQVTPTPTPAPGSLDPDPADRASYCQALTADAVTASRALATIPGQVRDQALRQIADALDAATPAIQAANALDLKAAPGFGLTDAMIDRLRLTDDRIAAMASSVRQIAGQTDPLGRVLEGKVLTNGLRLQKLAVPLGVVLFIYESRPNVTSDAAALCLKSGNALILRGGKEAFHSNTAIAACISQSLSDAGIDPRVVQLVNTTDRAAVGELLQAEGKIDVCIPRGGKSLIRAVVDQARVPVIKHYTGNCHVYIHGDADPDMAVEIAVNAKTQRPGVCNATETILVHRDAAKSGLLARLCGALADQGVEIRGDTRTCAEFDGARPATEDDWHDEYLDLIVAVRVVDDLDAAIDHINTYGSKHTDAIVTTRLDAANRFVLGVDSADVFVNCSTRFSDGGQYGLGAEIGISTDKLHARGPMGAADMTTYKWVAYGTGQIRS